MAAEGYVIFEDTTWYQKHKEEIKEQIISLDTYVRHPMQIGAYLIKEGEYWLKKVLRVNLPQLIGHIMYVSF